MYLGKVIQDARTATLSPHFNTQLDSRNQPKLFAMQWKALVLSLIAGYGIAQFNRMPMLRFSCSQLVVERLDPLVNPGMNPSPHVHQIVGKSSKHITDAFGFHVLPVSRLT